MKAMVAMAVVVLKVEVLMAEVWKVVDVKVVGEVGEKKEVRMAEMMAAASMDMVKVVGDLMEAVEEGAMVKAT